LTSSAGTVEHRDDASGELDDATRAVPAGGDVLVIEDDDDLRDMISQALESAGYRVRAAANGVEGLSLLHFADRPLGVVLLDLGLSDMNGFEFLVQLSADPVAEAVPVIVMTGRRELDDSDRPTAWVHTIRKPMTIGAVLDAVRRYAR
jgi:DNA-binding response OmpR family regulator